MSDLTLETFSLDEPLEYNMLDGTKIRIGRNDSNFFQKILALPVIYKVQLLGLTEEDVEEFLNAKRIALELSIRELLKKKWKSRETGELLVMDDLITYDFPEFGNLKSFKKDLKNKKLTISMMQKFYNYLNNEENVYL